jgi:hypothetical protein
MDEGWMAVGIGFSTNKPQKANKLQGQVVSCGYAIYSYSTWRQFDERAAAPHPIYCLQEKLTAFQAFFYICTKQEAPSRLFPSFLLDAELQNRVGISPDWHRFPPALRNP